MYKSIHSYFPGETTKFINNSQIHTYHTRQHHKIHKQQVRTKLAQFSFINHGPIIWNKLPTYISQSNSFHKFKSMLKWYLIHNTNKLE